MSIRDIEFANTVRRSPRRLARLLWDNLPEPVTSTSLMMNAGRHIYRRFTRDTVRLQTHYTCFMRNPPLLRTLAGLAANHDPAVPFEVASIGCSTGAELYSLLYVLRTAHPRLSISGTGVDLSEAVVETARSATYRVDAFATDDALFGNSRPEVLSEELGSVAEIFEPARDGSLKVRDWVTKQTRWLAGDATDGRLLTLLGEQDIVLANNVMGPMEDNVAQACLRNVMSLVRPGGLLVVDGVDLDLKTKVLMERGYEPVSENIEEIWTADKSKDGWPWLRWGREPFDANYPDSQWRYGTIFRRIG